MTDTKRLFNAGENLRSEQPVLWGILRGRGTDFRIALLIGWPEKRVYDELMDLRRAGAIKQNSQGTWFLVRGYEHYEEYMRIRALYQMLDQRIADDHPGKVELSELSSKARAEARKTAAKERAKVPTEVQLKMVTAAFKAFGRATFSPLDLARAQGYAKAGWSKSYLETLERKGYVQQMGMRGRSTTWQLTDAGVEWASKGL